MKEILMTDTTYTQLNLVSLNLNPYLISNGQLLISCSSVPMPPPPSAEYFLEEVVRFH